MLKIHKKIKVSLIVGVIVLLVFTISMGIIGNYFLDIAVKRKVNREFLVNSEDLVVGVSSVQYEVQNAQQQWIADTDFEQVERTSYDGLKLQGYIKMQDGYTDKWVVVVHGYTSKADDMRSFAYRFSTEGYNVLLPDLKSHGRSEGEYIGMGWNDRRDIIMWINEITGRDSQAQIALYGVSMGAAAVMMTSGEKLPDNVKCIIEDCGYTSAYDVFKYQMGRIYNFPSFPILDAANAMCKILAGYSFKEASALEQIKKCEKPIFFIHGDADTFVPYEMVYSLYEAVNCEKELYIAPGGWHGGASEVDDVTYWNKVYDFLERYIS